MREAPNSMSDFDWNVRTKADVARAQDKRLDRKPAPTTAKDLTATPQREINDVIDYKNLLWKYINYVREEESITFIERIGDSWVDHEIAFTDEETVELRRLDAMKEYE